MLASYYVVRHSPSSLCCRRAEPTTWEDYAYAIRRSYPDRRHPPSALGATLDASYALLLRMYEVTLPALQCFLQQRSEMMNTAVCRITPLSQLQCVNPSDAILRFNASGTKTMKVAYQPVRMPTNTWPRSGGADFLLR